MERNQWVNLRGVATLSVIVIHATTLKFFSPHGISNILNLFFDQISRFAVPVFFVSSGFGLTTKYYYDFYILEFYKKRLKIIPMYLIWTVIYFLILSDKKSTRNLLSDILTGKAGAHLYFIIVLIIFYCLYPFLKNIATTKVGLSFFFCLSFIGQLYYQTNSEWGYPYIWNWIFYFVFGIYLAINKNLFCKIKKNSTILFSIGIVLLLVTTFLSFYCSDRSIVTVTTAMRPVIIIYSIGVLSFFLDRFPDPVKFLKVLDDNSLDVYYVHLLILMIFNKMFEIAKIDYTRFSSSFVLILLTTVASLVFSVFRKYIVKKILVSLK